MVKLSPLRRFVVGESISIFGSQMALIIIPLLAVEVLAASEWHLGVLTAIEYIPFVVLGLLFGAIIDATSVRNTLLLSNFGRLILLTILGLLVIFNGLSLWLLICIVFLLSTLSTFFDLAVQSAVPFMAPKGMLGRVNSGFEMVRGTATTAGPPLATFLFAVGGSGFALLGNAVTYTLGIWGSWGVPATKPQPGASRPTVRYLLGSAITGLRYIAQQRHDLVVVILAAFTNNIAMGALVALQYAFMVRDLELEPVWVGVTVAIAGLSSIGGAAIGGWVADKYGMRRTMIWSMVVANSAVAAFALAGPGSLWSVAYVGATLGVIYSGNTAFNIAMITYRQSTVPAELLARVNAGARAAIMVGVPIGALVGGALASFVGIRLAVLSLALLAIIPLLFIVFVAKAPALENVGEAAN